jgi:hypothetical protein
MAVLQRTSNLAQTPGCNTYEFSAIAGWDPRWDPVCPASFVRIHFRRLPTLCL